MSVTLSPLLPDQAYVPYRNGLHCCVRSYQCTRSMMVGDHALLRFENEQTIRSQLWDMLRVVRVEDIVDMQEQINTYMALLPNGENWKATLIFQTPDTGLGVALQARLNDISRCFYVTVQGHAPIHAVVNKGPAPADERTSTVHFLRFDLPLPMRQAIREGGAVVVGCDHPDYLTYRAVPEELRDGLATELHCRSHAFSKRRQQ